jgi:MHS family alpha-ketoglutarate permease-like MFS transporter
VGAVVEAFDWNIYAVLAPFFAADLFGEGSGASGLLAAYVGFAVGFVGRPLGSAVIGRISDTRGRRFGLTLSMSVIAVASLGLALLPTQAAIGVWAAVLTVAVRFVQGLAYGGETPTVAAYVTETAPARRRWLFSAVSYSGVVLGSLLSFAVLTVLYAVFGAEGLSRGGWRWGFVIAALLGLAAVWVRRTAPESEDFRCERASNERRVPLRSVFRDHPWSVLTLFLQTLGGTVMFYFGLIYLPVYADAVGAASKESAASFMTVVSVVVLVAMLLVGVLADRFGALRMLRIGFASFAVLVLPLLSALQHGWLPFQAVAVAYGVLVATSTATVNVFSGSLFPTRVRAVGVGIVGAVTIGLFGGTFPLLAEWLHASGRLGLLPYYVTVCSLAALLSTFTATRVPALLAAMRPTGPEKTDDAA